MSDGLVACFVTELLFSCQNSSRWGGEVPNSWWAALALLHVGVGFTRPPSMVTPGTPLFFLLGLVKFAAGRNKGLVVLTPLVNALSRSTQHSHLPYSRRKCFGTAKGRDLDTGIVRRLQQNLGRFTLDGTSCSDGPGWFPNTCSPSQNVPSFWPGMSHAAWNLAQNRAGFPPLPPHCADCHQFSKSRKPPFFF